MTLHKIIIDMYHFHDDLPMVKQKETKVKNYKKAQLFFVRLRNILTNKSQQFDLVGLKHPGFPY